jgi:chemotaxis protein CheZ
MRAVSIVKEVPVTADETTSLQQVLRDVVRGEIGGMFDDLRRFVDRRIAELSTEIHAALEMVDVSEHHLSDQLQEMQGALARVAVTPASATRSSRLKLEDLVQATEDAANNIMTAAEMIRSAVDAPDGKDVIIEQVEAILDACKFRDLTWQRVRRALEQLRLESAQAQTADESSAAVERQQPEPGAVRDVATDGPELSQDEINRLFS